MKYLWMMILVGGLGAGCGKKENPEVGKSGEVPPKPVAGQQPKPTEPKPPALVAAWEEAGFLAGWMGPDKKSGIIVYNESLKELEASRAVPAFRPFEWEPEILESLPAPTTAFGLDLSYTQITDAGLKEVAKLQQLTSLNLVFTKTTDAGVAELKKTLPKCDIRFKIHF